MSDVNRVRPTCFTCGDVKQRVPVNVWRKNHDWWNIESLSSKILWDLFEVINFGNTDGLQHGTQHQISYETHPVN